MHNNQSFVIKTLCKTALFSIPGLGGGKVKLSKISSHKFVFLTVWGSDTCKVKSVKVS